MSKLPRLSNPVKRLSPRLFNKLQSFRHSLAYIDALPQLSLLGFLVGVATALVIIAFRWLVDVPLALFIPMHSENFEALATHYKIGLLATGGAAIYFILKIAGSAHTHIGVSHVLYRVHQFQGRLPLRNWLVQFFSGAIAIGTGQSVGKEGPSVHLGAGAGSFLGKWMKLPNNSLNTLVGCGVAAAISASFDTPMAGVIFAMEVILLEYSVVGFIPVILASVTAAAITQSAYPNSHFFINNSADIGLSSLIELPLVFVSGLIIALAAGLFIRLNLQAMSYTHKPLSLRIICAVALNICIAAWVPEVMGLGYDTLNAAMAQQIALGSLILIAMAKILTASIGIGLGIPGGLIGPMLLSGGCIGGAIGLTAQLFFPSINVQPGFYVMIGMAGMMAAVVNAPLAALVAVLELTYNPNIIFPSMLTIVVACIGTRSLFNVAGIFQEQLNMSDRQIRVKPAQQALQKAGVRSLMETALASCYRQIDYDSVKELLRGTPKWIVVSETQKPIAIRASHIAAWLEQAPTEILTLAEDIDLFAVPAERIKLTPIHETASLWEAYSVLQTPEHEALYISHSQTPAFSSIQGILTLEDFNDFYTSL